MASLKIHLLSFAALALVASAPLTAHAIEVECELKDGSVCTVSNDPFDTVSCECAESGAGGSTGGEMWADLDEEGLLEVCLAEVAFCEANETDGMSTGMSSTTTVGDTGGTVGDTVGASSTGGDGTTGGGSDTDGGSDGSSSTGEEPGGSGPSTTPSDTDGSTASGGGDDGGPVPTTTGTPPPAGSSSGGEAEGSSEDPSGCSVGATGAPGAMMALFGLVLGLRRRRIS